MFEEEEALFRLGLMRGEQLPDIACAMLDAGFDAQPIRELAGMTKPTLRDAGALFEAALVTLGRQRLSREQMLSALRNHVLRRTASGVVSPIAGAREIAAAWYPLGHPKDLSVFVYLDDLWDECPDKRADIEQEIVDRARAMLPGVSGECAS